MLHTDAVPVKPFSKAANDYQPIWPTWSLFSKRLESYKDSKLWGWSTLVRKLAAAGFFYFEPEDKVRCFYCNLALNKWKPNDEPFEEHERHDSRCVYFTEIVAPPPCVYNAATQKPCGQTEKCPFCKWEAMTRKQLSEDLVNSISGK